jgi:hypothetical protein
MAHYYVSKLSKANGDCEVHTSICILLPRSDERLALGYHETSRQAVEYAILNFRQATGCSKCCINFI